MESEVFLQWTVCSVKLESNIKMYVFIVCFAMLISHLTPIGMVSDIKFTQKCTPQENHHLQGIWMVPIGYAGLQITMATDS